MAWHFSAEVLLSTEGFLDNQLLLKEQVTAVAKRDFAKTKHSGLDYFNRICVSLHLKIMWKVQLIYNATALLGNVRSNTLCSNDPVAL